MPWIYWVFIVIGAMFVIFMGFAIRAAFKGPQTGGPQMGHHKSHDPSHDQGPDMS